MEARKFGNRNEDIVRNDDAGAHTDTGAVRKDNSGHVDSNHDKEKDSESFTHLLFFVLLLYEKKD